LILYQTSVLCQRDTRLKTNWQFSFAEGGGLIMGMCK